ncbi:hypothetical protein ANRL3_00682 [Anaerolineae bacterium]|nr:hypothetical protein ANRL3_00682 [Anaerolineae bacterium]
MTTEAEPVHLNLFVDAGRDTGAEELDRLTRQLLSEMQAIDVESVDLVGQVSTPAGAKVVDPVTLGALAIVVLPAVLPKLIEFLQALVIRKEDSVVKIKLQRGDRSIEIERPVKSMSRSELKSEVEMLTDLLLKKK